MAENYQKVLEENNSLFKLYIASHRLHSSLAREEVLDVISEIVLNLIGAEGYAIYAYDQDEQVLSPMIVRGVEDRSLGSVSPGEGPIGQAIESRKIYTVNPNDTEDSSTDEFPMAVIPLRNREHLVGAIAVYRLLSHKPGLRSVDYQLFEYLATHAAMALHSASLYAESERKVMQMKEFLTNMENPGEAPGVGSEDR
jgi:GAF domain-containing protein